MKDIDPGAHDYVELLWLLHNGDSQDKSRAREILQELSANGPFRLNNLIQTYPFDCFNTFRTDKEIVAFSRARLIDLSEHPYIRMQREFRK